MTKDFPSNNGNCCFIGTQLIISLGNQLKIDRIH